MIHRGPQRFHHLEALHNAKGCDMDDIIVFLRELDCGEDVSEHD
jgi:hypothetical protein